MGYFDAGDDNQQSMASSFQYGGDAFADVNNLDHCIKYLNQTLTMYGFPSTLDLHSNDPASIVQICNCIYALLQQRQRDIEFRGVAEDQKQRVMSDMSRLEAKVERQDAQLTAKERELASLTSKVQKGAVAFKAQLEKVQHERDEFQRLVVSTQQVRVQQSHELKKKEKEYIKLQEKLNQVLTEKKKETKPALEIMNLLQKEGRQRGTWNSKKADGDFYKMIVDAYEAKKQELMAENTDLRALLRSMQSDMRDFLNAPNALSKANSLNGSFDVEQPSTPQAGSTDVFDLPFHMARDQIEQSLRAKLASIKERMIQLQEAQKVSKLSMQCSDRELELEAQLVEARSIISEQASFMGKHLTEDLRSYALTPMAAEMALPEADEDRAASPEHAYQQLEEVSSMRTMVAEPIRMPVEVDIARRGMEKEVWSENQTYKLENAKSESKTQFIYAEMEGSSEAHELSSESPVVMTEMQKCGPESLQVLQDNGTNTMHSPKSYSIGLTSQETLGFFSENVNLLFESQSAPRDHRHVWVEVCSSCSASQGVQSTHQPIYTEPAPQKWCNYACHSFETADAGCACGRTTSPLVPHEYAGPETQAARLGIKIHSETQPLVRDLLEDAKRSWFDCTNSASDHSQTAMQIVHVERKRLCPMAQSQESGFDLDRKQHETQETCPAEAMSLPEFSSSWSNSRSSQQGFQSDRPVFRFIVDDVWLEESQRCQDGVSQLDILVPSEVVLSQRVQLKTWMENNREDGLCHEPSTHLQALHGPPSEPQNERISCFCFHMPSVFFSKKK